MEHLDALATIMRESFKWCHGISSCMIDIMSRHATIGRDCTRCNRASPLISTSRSTSWTLKYAKNATKYWASRRHTNALSVITRVINIVRPIRWAIITFLTTKWVVALLAHLTPSRNKSLEEKGVSNYSVTKEKLLITLTNWAAGFRGLLTSF